MVKRFYFIIFILFFLSHRIYSQRKYHGYSSLYLGITSPVSFSKSTNTFAGSGIELGTLSRPITIIKGSKISYFMPTKPPALALQFGGTLTVASFGWKNFKNIPLLSPENGKASVNISNSYVSLNVSSRLSTSIAKGKVLPYIEGFVGYRYTSSSMNIKPNNINLRNTDTTLAFMSGWHYGINCGARFKISDDIFIDIGASYSHSESPGKMIDLRSIQHIGNGLTMNSIKSPQDYILFKIGLCAYMTNTNNSGSHHYRYHSIGHFHSGGGGHSHISINIR